LCYPGTRSDSDLYTFGYRFKPWTSAPIATRAEILDYMGEVIAENGIDRHIRYRHTISVARWSSSDKLWMLQGTRTDTGGTVRFTGNFCGCVRDTTVIPRATRWNGAE
jgi:cation diffusion facilitator CzcD-associated flavoprotein CzcO